MNSSFSDFQMIMDTLYGFMFTPIPVFGFYITLESTAIWIETIDLILTAWYKIIE